MRSESEIERPSCWPSSRMRAYVMPLVAIPTAFGLPQLQGHLAPSKAEIVSLSGALSELGKSLDIRLIEQNLFVSMAADGGSFSDITLPRTPKRVRHLHGVVVRKPRGLSLSEGPKDLAAYLDAPSV